jgi:cysteine desulfurase
MSTNSHIPIIYLDHAATTSVDKRVLAAMLPYFSKNYGNASSLHSLGFLSRKVISQSRTIIGEALNTDPKNIIFTGSGTEANNLAILGTANFLKTKGKHIITSLFEHPSVGNTIKSLKSNGWDVTRVPVNRSGIIDLMDIENAIRDDTVLISIMTVNNEIGTIQNIAEIGAIAKKKNIIFHTDAIQAYGKMHLDVESLNVDLLSASAHKIYGPKGIGFLYIRDQGIHPNLGKFIQPISYGGGHEYNFRPATENIPAIVGFAEATKIALKEMDKNSDRLQDLRDDFIDWALSTLPDCFLNGHRTQRLYNNINLGFKYIEGESLVLHLSDKGLAVSTGSACSSHSLRPSDTLIAIGLDTDDAQGSLRITLGRENTKEQLNYLKQNLQEIVKRLRAMSPLTPN